MTDPLPKPQPFAGAANSAPSSNTGAGWSFPQVGQRVRLTESCPWPARVGCTATVCAPYEDGTYPQPAKWEVIVLIDNDPLASPGGDPQWSCVLSAKNCDVIQ